MQHTKNKLEKKKKTMKKFSTVQYNKNKSLSAIKPWFEKGM